MRDKFEKRLARLRASIIKRGLHALLITGPENRFYYSGFWAEDMGCTESAGALLITRNENILLTDGRYSEQAEKQAKGFHIHTYRKGLARRISRLFRELGIKRCGFEPGNISVSSFEQLKRYTQVEWIKFSGFTEKIRAVKEPNEIEIIKQAQKKAETVFETILEDIVPGMTEKEIAFAILKGLYQHADGPSFPPIVASGPNSAMPHAVPTDRRIKEQEPVIIDMGARFRGYCSDMTRTIFIGEPSDELKHIYKTVKNAQEEAQKMIRDGITARSADLAARKIIEDAGYGPYFCHGLGHGVGIAIHETPAVSYRNRKKLRNNNVITIEPGIYITGLGGVRLENMAVVDNDGIDIITSLKWYYDF